MTQEIPHNYLASVKSNGIEIVFDSFGDAADPPLLLVQGLGAQLIAWDEEFCAQLAAHGFWVIRFDNRDVGLSTRFDMLGVPDVTALYQAMLQEKTVQAAYTLYDMTGDALGLLDALGIDSVHIVGLSMGGMIAQLIAIHWPERVRTLTSIMSSTGDSRLPIPKPEALSVLLEPPPTYREGYIENAVQAAWVLCGPGFPPDEEHIRDVEGQAFDRGPNPAGVARHFAAMIASGSRKEALESIAAPTLVIHGDADPVFPIQCGIATARMIPGAKMMVIEGLGHYFPPAVWSQVINAITSHAL